eukprot:GHVR01010604.1.p1 GENE.GHVR01010604.1~~GHVR01010604.1.p1  ORF type:complete len:449 (+),score=84.89 GHVR01010604.1:25-1347(+)
MKYLVHITFSISIISLFEKVNGLRPRHVCPSGYTLDGDICESVEKSCTLANNIDRTHIKVGSPPEIHCEGEMVNGKCIVEEFEWPIIRCPPGFVPKLMTVAGGATTGGVFEPTHRIYSCLMESEYSAEYICNDIESTLTNGSCLVPLYSEPVFRCPDNFVWFDSIDKCVPITPKCPYGWETRRSTDSKTVKKIIKFSTEYKSRWDKNHDGIFDLDTPLDSVCVYYDEVPPSSQCDVTSHHHGGCTNDDNGCPQGYNYVVSDRVCVKIISKPSEVQEVPPKLECLRPGSYLNYNNKCLQINSIPPSLACRDGDFLVQAGLVKSSRPTCRQNFTRVALPICPPGFTLTSRVYPPHLKERLGWDLFKADDPLTPEPLCVRQVVRPLLVSCHKHYEFVDGSCLKYSRVHDENEWRECAPLTTEPRGVCPRGYRLYIQANKCYRR